MPLTFKSLGKAVTGVAKKAAPFVAFANPALGLGLGLAGGLGHGKDSARKMGQGALTAGLGAGLGKLGNVSKLGVLGGVKNLGGKALAGLGQVGKGIGKAGKLVGAVNPDGSLNLQNLMGLGMAGSAFKGSRDEGKAAQGFNAQNALLRQQMMERLSKSPDYSALMERITARPNYNLS